jgi:hypothetical protein
MDPGNPVVTARSAFDQADATVGEAITAIHQTIAAVSHAITTELAAVPAPTPAGLSESPAQ